MFWQVLLGLALACAVFLLDVAAVRTDDEARRGLLLARIRRGVLAYAAVAFVLALFHWSHHRDWVHLLWICVNPQCFAFLGVGAFLASDDLRRRAGNLGRGLWIFGAVLLAFAVLPAVLIEWAPKSNAAPRNLGRPVAGALEVARLGLGGPVPDVLVPVNDAGVERGLGFLPREITVTIGGLVAGATLWIATCLIALAGGLLRSARARLGVFLFAPFVVAAAMLFAPMPFGMLQRPLWDADPALLRAFGPLLVLAGLAACGLALKDVARRLVGRAGRMAEERTDRSPSARAG